MDSKCTECRFCLRKLDSNERMALIDEEINDQFTQVTQISLEFSDELSHIICELCLRSLQLASALKIQFIENQKKLLESNKSGHNSVNQSVLVPKEVEPVDFYGDHANLLDCQLEIVKKEKEDPQDVSSFDYQQVMYRREESLALMRLNDAMDRDQNPKNTQNLKCHVCEKVFKHRSYLEGHFLRFTSDVFECDVCGKRFHTKFAIRNHHVQRHSPKSKQCPKCSNVFSCGRLLKEHIRINHQNQRYYCGLCNKIYLWNNACRKHIKKHHPEVKSEDIKYFTKSQAIGDEEIE